MLYIFFKKQHGNVVAPEGPVPVYSVLQMFSLFVNGVGPYKPPKGLNRPIYYI